MTYRDITPDDLTLPGEVLGGALDSMLAGDDLYGDEFECSPGAWRVRDALCRVLMTQDHDLLWLHAAELRGDVTPLVAAALWWCSALRVEAEVGPVAGLRGPWKRASPAGCHERETKYRRAGIDCGAVSASVWRGRPAWKRTSRTESDVESIEHAVALRNPDHLLLPLPDAVARLPLENA